MSNRNFSLYEYFIARSLETSPKLCFQGGDVREWQQELNKKVLELLGSFPKPVPLHPETIWSVEKEDLIKEKVIFDSEENASVPAIVIRPSSSNSAKSFKTIICLHGHGPDDNLHQFGKDPVVGNKLSLKHEQLIRQYNYNYAEQLARKGYLTIAPDFRNFGERNDANLYPGRDSCNVHFIRGLLLGINLITLNIWDVMRTIDYLMSRDDVDVKSIGCVGLSFGGTMALHVAALDSRVKATAISCALTSYETYAIRMGNFCGSQFIPGIFQYANLSDLAGLIAPRPLFIQNGVNDLGFPIEESILAQNHLKQIYQSAGAEEALTIEIFDGAHEFHGEKIFPFFKNWLEDDP